ncbi:MAG: phosphoribosylanthranilate isomerase [Candidatus Peribacter sp.]|jgi:phosphoribosylanthranilate isomerase
MKPKVKFCGMTRSADIEAAEELVVDFIGFVFVPSSPRFVTFTEAQKLRESIRSAKAVGVFMGTSVVDIQRGADALQLDFIQLHDAPDIDRVKNISKSVIQAFSGVPDLLTLETFLQYCPYVMIDKKKGEDEVDFEAVAMLPLHIRSKLFLAGGLTPGNVRSAVDRVQPFAVDSARGIESEPGIKNHHRMLAFFQALS